MSDKIKDTDECDCEVCTKIRSLLGVACNYLRDAMEEMVKEDDRKTILFLCVQLLEVVDKSKPLQITKALATVKSLEEFLRLRQQYSFAFEVNELVEKIDQTKRLSLSALKKQFSSLLGEDNKGSGPNGKFPFPSMFQTVELPVKWADIPKPMQDALKDKISTQGLQVPPETKDVEFDNKEDKDKPS